MSDHPQRPRHTLPRAFACAIDGLWTLLKTERNPRIQIVLALIAVAMGIGLRIGPAEWCLVVICMMAVLVAEAINSALERAVDHTSLATHPLAKQAKDLAAASVLIAAGGAAIVGAIIFIPKLLALLKST